MSVLKRFDGAVANPIGTATATTLGTRTLYADTVCAGNAVGGTGGTTTASSTTFTDAGAAFTSADTGKSIAIAGADVAGGQLVTTVTYVNATTLTLATAATTAVTAARYVYGTDDSGALQNLINTCNAGIVVLGIKRYLLLGGLTIPTNVTLAGSSRGPWHFRYNPGLPTSPITASILMAVGQSASAISINGYSVGVEDLIVHYPTQIAPTVSGTPVVFPISINNQGQNYDALVRRVTLTNAYKGLYLSGGQAHYSDINLGCLSTAVEVDQTFDCDYLNNIHIWPFYSIMEGSTFPKTLDTWVRNNSVGFLLERCDSIFMTNVFAFYRLTGFVITDSPIAAITPKCGYGQLTNVGADSCGDGVIISATNTPGYVFSNFQAITNTRLPFSHVTGGSMTPLSSIAGGVFTQNSGSNTPTIGTGTHRRTAVLGAADV